jgi:probable rRNA maturation factor
MINVDVFSEEKSWSKRLKKKEFFFKKICKAFPTKYKFINKKVSLSLLLSNNKNIRKLNKNFRNKDKPTDVLSFPFEKNLNIKTPIYLGDIIISYEFMNRPKSLDNLGFKKKVAKVFIHGFIHLLGYDHIRLKDYKKMIKEEEKIYKTINTKIANLV